MHTFPNIGIPGLEIDANPLVPFEINVMDEWSDGSSAPRPVCPTRHAFAELMALQALELIFHHEFAHHYNGHVAWRLAEHPNVRLNGSEGQLPEQLSLDLRTLEMDADQRAAQHVTQMWVRSSQSISAPPVQGGALSLDTATDISIYWSSIAFYSALRLMDLRGNDRLNLITRGHSHPPLPIRMYWISASIAEAAHVHFKRARTVTWPIVLFGVAEAERYARTALGAQALEIADEAIEKATSDELNCLKANWHSLRGRLSPYFRGIMLPPTDDVGELTIEERLARIRREARRQGVDLGWHQDNEK
jgi:hypothetical protein